MFTHIYEEDVQNFKILYLKLKEKNNILERGSGHISALQISQLAKVDSLHANISATFKDNDSKFSAYLLHVAGYWKKITRCILCDIHSEQLSLKMA